MKLHVLVAFFGSLCIQYVVTKDDCEMAKSCEECTKMRNCTWCEKAENISSKMVRCRSVSEDLSGWNEDCGQQFTAESGNMILLKSLPLSFSDGFSFERAPNHPLLIQPQKVSMKLKAVHPQNVTMNIRIAQDDPVDVYLLIDFSSSTDEYKAFLSTLVHKLAEKIPKMASNFRIGFGSIIACDICAFSSGFQNFLSLSGNLETFLGRIDKFIRDAVTVPPSDKLDVILQAINCDMEIAWRKTAKKLLIFTSNAASIKNDPGQEEFGISNRSNASEYCDLNAEGLFRRNENYPFIHEVFKASQREKIQILWVAPIEKLGSYHELSKFIRGSIPTQMTPDARIVLRTLKKKFKRIGRIKLQDSAQQPVSLRYFSRCGRKGIEKETSFCKKVRLTEVIQFKIEVAVADCPSGPFLQRQTFEIFSADFSDILSLDVQIIFGCECDPGEKQITVYEPRECDGHGHLWNGACECMTGYYGRRCEFSHSELNSSALDDRCKASVESAICSGRGTCIGGMCSCYGRDNPIEIISGRFCECSNFLCPRSNGMLCSGPDHGICRCDECICHPGWMGEACDCSTSTTNCVDPGTGNICSLNGLCHCNGCKCFHPYTGQYCENCPTCRSECHLFKPCVECNLVRGDCDEQCSSLGIHSIIPEPMLKVNYSEEESFCRFADTNDCFVNFVFRSKNFGEPYIRVQMPPECPRHPLILERFLSVIYSLVSLL